MQPAHALPASDLVRDPDQRVILRNVGWDDYERVLAMRGDAAGVRICYLEGALELMAPSGTHETIKTRLARLLEAYAEELGIDLNGFGSWTIKRREIFQDAALTPYVLRNDAWIAMPRSELLPAIDLDLLVRLLEEPSQLAAVRSLRASVRNPSKP